MRIYSDTAFRNKTFVKACSHRTALSLSPLTGFTFDLIDEHCDRLNSLHTHFSRYRFTVTVSESHGVNGRLRLFRKQPFTFTVLLFMSCRSLNEIGQC